MPRIKQDPPKILTAAEKATLEALYTKEDLLLDWLLEHSSDHPDYPRMIHLLHETGKEIVTMEGGNCRIQNCQFRCRIKASFHFGSCFQSCF